MGKLSVLTLIDINPKKLGALEEYCLHLSKELIERGHRSVIGFSQYPPDWLMKNFNSAGIQVLKLNLRNGRIHFILDLRKAIRKHEINIVHATFYDIYSLNILLAACGNSCKVFYSDQVSRVSHPPKGLKSIFRFLRNRFYQRFIHTIIADAEFISQCQIRDSFTKPSKIQIIYNGVNLQRFAKVDPVRKSEILNNFNISSNSSVIVTIAQCIPEKGLNYFLDAAGIVVKERPDTTFFVIGDGPERSCLEQKADELCLKENVIFTGLRIDTELFLSVADVFVLLSVWEEAFAFSLLEAMASGCPVVASRIGAIPESVKEGVTGILVPPRDANAAAEAIIKLLKYDDIRSNMGLAARQRVENHFTLNHWVSQTIKIFEQAFGIGAHE